MSIPVRTKKAALERTASLLFMHHPIADKLVSTRACFPFGMMGGIYGQKNKKSPTIFQYITTFDTVAF